MRAIWTFHSLKPFSAATAASRRVCSRLKLQARQNRWELNIPKPFLKPGAFHLQQIQTISTAKLERRLGVLTHDEMKRVRDALNERLNS